MYIYVYSAMYGYDVCIYVYLYMCRYIYVYSVMYGYDLDMPMRSSIITRFVFRAGVER
jgi:hypothetical protein